MFYHNYRRHLRSVLLLFTNRKNMCKTNLKNTPFYAEKRLKIGTFAHDKKLWKITTI